jgi:Fe-Mn family superoxide dismutase
MDAMAGRGTVTDLTAYTARHYEFYKVDGLSEKALDLHMQLYKGYVKQVNQLQKQVTQLAKVAKLSDGEQLQKDALVRRMAFEYNGMVLHEWFFEQLDGGTFGYAPSPGSMLTEVLDRSFGGIDGWHNDIVRLAETRGVGWVVSARHPGSNRMQNFWVAEHHLGMPAGLEPVAVFDIWEHAYLLDFAPGARRDYLAVLFRNLDWSILERRCLPRSAS